MKPQDIADYIVQLKERFKTLEERLQDPSIYSKQAECKAVSREHQHLGKLFKNYARWNEAIQEYNDNKEMLSDETDEEMQEVIQMDIDTLSAELIKLEQDVQIAIIPQDNNEGKNIIVEIHPAAGGDEAGIFAADMFRLYTRYAEIKKWKCDLLEYTSNDVGGIKLAMFSLSGDDVFSKMKFESGVHRVQRIPTTESAGRVHTSTVTVAVLAEAEEVELDVRNEDLRIDTFRASGPGGQCVNTTDSAVRITHIPTGTVAVSQQEKSQHKNKDFAMRILRARILEKQQAEEAAKQAAAKQAQVGTGDRSERIRTYNYPQSRISDHRYNLSSYDLPKIMEGEIDSFLDDLTLKDSERKLEALNIKVD